MDETVNDIKEEISADNIGASRTVISPRVGTRNEDDTANFIMANEYMDFCEFMENELGLPYYKECRDKFFVQQDKLMTEFINEFTKR
jgi:hypothetical protein